MKRAQLFAAVLAAFSVSVLSAERDPVERVLDARLQLVYRAQKEAAAARVGGPSTAGSRATALLDRLLGRDRSDMRTRPAATPHLSLLVRYAEDCHSLEGAGFRFQAQVGPICTGTLEPERLGDLARLGGVQHVALSQTLRATAPCAAPRAETSAASMAVRPLLKAQSDLASSPLASPRVLSGSGAIVAFIDTGVDVFHQDFRKADGTTRIKYLLDLSDPGDIDADGDLDGVGPFGGTLYTEAQINADLSGGSMREKDTTGHGTHGLSIAAGDDASFPGIAPGSDLLVVKATRDDGTLGFVSTDVINALVFVDQKATELGLPYVVNLSLGTIVAPHDGRSLEEQAIDTIVGQGRPGKVAVLAAGNSSDNRSARFHHLSGTAYTGLGNTHTLTVPAFTANPGPGNDRIFLDVWYKGRDKLKLTVTPPGGAPVTAAFGNYLDLETPQGNVFIANLGGPSLENGDVEALILIDDWAGTAPASGNWTISFQGEEIGDTGEYHAWLADDSQVGSVSPYLSANADNRFLIGKPGSAQNGITVGSYARHDPTTRFRTSWTDVNSIPRSDTSAVQGDISDFSSTGKTRDGRVKPEVVAPGERVLGAVSKDAFPGVAPNSIYRFHPFPEATGLLTDASPDHAFGLLQGTSFSAPVVAGLAARILSTNPTLDAIQVRNVLINSVTTDAFTGAVPNDVWGYGKVDLSVGGATLPGNLRITTDTLPAGVLNDPYDQVLTASGGKLPYSWSLAGGALPTGLTLDATGHITGVVTGTGTFNFTARVTDTSAPAQSVTRMLQLGIASAHSLEVLTDALPSARVGTVYDETLQARGGAPPYTWSLAGGSLPPGLSLLASGNLQGTATALGRYSFTARVGDAAAGTAFGSVRVKVSLVGAGVWDPLGILATTVNNVVVDPNDSRHLFASTENAFDRTQDQVYETTDGGESWRSISVNNGFGGSHPRLLAVNPQSSRLWAVTAFSPNEILRHDAASQSWSNPNPCNFPTAYPFVDDIGFDPPGSVYLLGNECVSRGAFRRSPDDGASWETLGTLCGGALTSQGPIGSGALAIVPTVPNRMYALRHGLQGTTDYSMLCRSDDGGRNWTLLGSMPRPGYWYDLQVSSIDPQDVIRAVDYPTLTVERSLDGGITWTSRAAPCGRLHRAMRRARSDPAVLLYGTFDGLCKSTDHGQTWTELTVKGSVSTEITSIAIDPRDAAVFYVGSARGVFATADGGLTWTDKSRGLVTRTLNGMALSRRSPSDVLLATRAGQPFLSRTSGERWVPAGANLSSAGVQDPVISDADPNLYFLAAPVGLDGIFRSENRGVTWTPAKGNLPSSSVQCIGADPFDANSVVVGVASYGLYRSVNKGASWAQVGANGTCKFPVDVSFARDVAGRAYAAVSCEGVLRSDDGGATWALDLPVAVTANLSVVETAPSDSRYVYAADRGTGPGTATVRFKGPSGVWQTAATSPAEPVLSLAVDWGNPQAAYAGVDHPGTVGGRGGIYRTLDGGQTWTRLPGELDAFDVVAVVTDPTVPGRVFAATREGGAFRSNDSGATWAPLDRYGSIGELVNVTLKHPSGALLFAGTEGYGVQVSSDGGRTFTPQVTGLANLNVNALAFEPGSATVLYAATDAGVFKSTDTGNTWAPTGLGAGEIADIVTDNEGVARRIWATVVGQGVAYSADGGTTFTLYNSGLASLELTSLELETVGVARRIWATTRGGDGVVFSDDLGQTWKTAAGSGLTDRNVNDFTHESGVARRIWGTARRIWATTDSGVFYSDNDGLSWSELSLGLPTGVPVTSVSIDPNTNEVMVSLFSDREGGVYRGANLNGLWAAFNDGLDELKVKKVTNDGGRVVDATTRATTFYAATSGDGAYQADVRTQTASSPTITTSSLATGTLRSAYSQTLIATGGTLPYTWSLPEGFIPPGLNLNGNTGVISGDPGQAGTFSFSVQVKEKEARIDRRALSIVIEDPLVPKITSFVPSSGRPGTSVSVNGLRFGGATAVTFAGAPASFSVSSDTVIQATVPAGAASGPIAVTTPLGSGRSGADFLVLVPQRLHTLTPCRVADTRDPAGPLGGPALAAGQDRSFVLRGACGVPSTAKTVSVNLTVTGPTQAGDLRVFPAGTDLPLVSSINYSPGQTRANNAVLTLSTGGAVTVRCDQAAGTVHLIVDVNGYFE